MHELIKIHAYMFRKEWELEDDFRMFFNNLNHKQLDGIDCLELIHYVHMLEILKAVFSDIRILTSTYGEYDGE